MKKNKDVLSYMYRYLEKYTGTYRVLAEYDKDSGDFPRDENGSIDDSFEDLYIPCRKGVIKHTYKDFDILAICFYDKASTAKNIYTELKDKYPKLDIELDLEWKDDKGKKVTNNDGYIYFNAKDIKKIATIVKPRTSGASIKWNSTKNLPKPTYEIPRKDLKRYNELIANLERVEKMHFSKSCSGAFLESISTKRFDARKEMKDARLKPKEYIHSIGKWDNYLKFVEKKLAEV